MSRLWQIVRDNNSTFYDFRTKTSQRIRARIAATALLSLALALLISGDISSFLNGVITVEAILIGFAFSVMFFLASTEANKQATDGSLEAEIHSNRLQQLARELFYNVSYFNLVSILCLALALALLLPAIWPFLSQLLAQLKVQTGAVRTAIYLVGEVGAFFVRLLFYFLLLESGYTFSRTVGRINYLFEQKVGHSPAKTNVP